MIYIARYLSRIKDKTITFKESILPLWVPVALILGMILPAGLAAGLFKVLGVDVDPGLDVDIACRLLLFRKV